jgi:hypothetical protein
MEKAVGVGLISHGGKSHRPGLWRIGCTEGLALVGKWRICKKMDTQPGAEAGFAPLSRYPNGERKLARDPFMQATWVLLGVAVLVQLFLLGWLDVTS